MTTPPSAETFRDSLDPHEIMDFLYKAEGLLEDGEAVDGGNWSIAVYAESAALGLTIMTGDDRDPSLQDSDTTIRFWMEIDDAYKTNAAFDGDGTELPILITWQTTSTPYRKRQRTILVRVAQQ